jgi:hypothetical protein
MASSSSREKFDELLYVVSCIGNLGSLRTVTVGLLILIEACLFENTSTLQPRLLIVLSWVSSGSIAVLFAEQAVL